ncbi:AAA domain (dynein-related subfamily) [Micromonospora echinofusca]|uniref:AAA domain (Dynein-related subfamily) n=1 Tax=Micromonospora echinofusca TaxID=47858 RepID=A0A1C5G9Z7_MICEH|nr:MoxR family ATPase [Micromonospora echinofusca]SCG16382.1 AAA domain (dynein-related subfamily) [Micromonospora echinofusca]
MSETPGWWIYKGTGGPHDGIERLPAPPPWRSFDEAATPTAPLVAETAADVRRGERYRPDQDTVELVNAALYLRRPLLVTGRPGTGKSTLAAAIAHELRLGRPLRWNITSRVTVKDGLYQYDPLARLYHNNQGGAAGNRGGVTEDGEDIGRFIRLGPLGTALLPAEKPRVLLIDEIDKGDLDLPNDLLTIFEDGAYEIPELVRQADHSPDALVMAADSTERVPIHAGRVRCRAFPLIVMTSNDEREFPPAFLRRCVQVTLLQPDGDKLARIVGAHLDDLADDSTDLIDSFLARREPRDLATDQLLNAIYLTDQAGRSGGVDRLQLADKVMASLSRQSDDD